MLLRTLSPQSGPQPGPAPSAFVPAFDAFLSVQKSPGTPAAWMFQSEHSRLAGQLAAALHPSIFGPLPAAVIQAIGEHDQGWDLSDQSQLAHLSGDVPRPFTSVSPADTLPCWIGSITHGSKLGPLQEVLISRHCCLLGTGSQDHEIFIRSETIRREQIERSLPYSGEQIDRWTDALGFCDLLSLYLCSGSQSFVELPLCHPTKNIPSETVTLEWAADYPVLSRPLFSDKAAFEAQSLTYSANRGVHSNPLSWRLTAAPSIALTPPTAQAQSEAAPSS